MNTSRKAFSLVALVAMVFVAAPAFAQPWRGVPSDSYTSGVNLLAGFPDGYDIYGAEVFKGFGAVTAGLEYGLATADSESAHTGRLNLGMQLPVGLDSLGLSVAPVVSPGYTSFDGGSTIDVPAGASVMFRVPAGQGMSVVPYAIPQFVWARTSFDTSTGDSESITDSEFAWQAGGNLIVNNLVFGVGYRKLGDLDGTIGLNVGMRLP